MEVSKNKVVAINYTLKDNGGQVIDSSEGKDPLHYIHGIGNLIPGMEEGLEGKKLGDKLDIKVSPEKGYGERDEKMIQKVDRKAFGDQDIKPGMQFQAGSENGTRVVTVTEVGPEQVTVDANHPLAGVELNFAVEVMSIRDASEEELAHGHVHGAGGHQH
jgi:FKBP-type peptidyl-prolyl cis-trans isomerase SlyD